MANIGKKTWHLLRNTSFKCHCIDVCSNNFQCDKSIISVKFQSYFSIIIVSISVNLYAVKKITKILNLGINIAMIKDFLSLFWPCYKCNFLVVAFRFDIVV